jgi:hypothetical protein
MSTAMGTFLLPTGGGRFHGRNTVSYLCILVYENTSSIPLKNVANEKGVFFLNRSFLLRGQCQHMAIHLLLLL